MRIEGAAYIVDLARPEAVRKEVGSADAVRKAPAGGGIDRVQISPQSRELEKLKRDLAALPDVRLDRVALAKQNLQDGGYQVQPALLAKKMMEAFGAAKGDGV